MGRCFCANFPTLSLWLNIVAFPTPPRLHVSQPALSQQIRQLEAMLEVQLFDRSGRRIRLTDAGEIWLEYARRALRDLEEGRRALHDAEDLQHGKLRIAMTPTFTTYMLGPLMEAYYRRYPRVKVLIQR